ncbi:MAG TPA: 4Fe-4S dicluster domain-containing protein [Bacteroidota bacterium]|nr:4Fe-4S dicluster domain-containing protein [Bacteroidota bacterium]
MAELVPIPLSTLLRRAHHEFMTCGAIFDLPKRKFYMSDAALDLSVMSAGQRAANPLGPAAGPHTQLAQNIALSWLAGSRIIELKTVQLNDRLELSRPCIDITTIGYNTEWSQELRLEESAREYVKASMMIEILGRWLFGQHGLMYREHANASQPEVAAFDTVFDVSVGYDLAGIQSTEIRRWLQRMLDASELIDELRNEIPEEFADYRDVSFRTKISETITLSTFHGTPASEIERICEFLMVEMGFSVVVKMNPPMLGRARLEHLLHETLGYANIEVNPHAYEVNMPFDDAVSMMKRLDAVAARNGKHCGVKFGNTLEVINNGGFLKDRVHYLSGQPLHVIHLALVEQWRGIFGASYPISFSAGVDANNFADCVSMGLVPVTTCTDLLRPGGYGRLKQYLVNLEQAMHRLGARTIDEFIDRTAKTFAQTEMNHANAVLSNTAAVVTRAMNDQRYRYESNTRPPRKIGSHLALWDCINCDKCIPVCPNAANFTIAVEPVTVTYRNIEITDSGWKEAEEGIFSIAKAGQICTYADACNECGNCDVFCPEDGGPYLEKPRFFGSLESFRRQPKVNGFVLVPGQHEMVMMGRSSGTEYELYIDAHRRTIVFQTPQARVTLEPGTQRVLDAVNLSPAPRVHVDLSLYYVMATLMGGTLRTDRMNFINAAFAVKEE